MKVNRTNCLPRGFTLVELLISISVLTIVGFLAYSMLVSSSTLFAKNISINTSNSVLRSALDKMMDDINQGFGIPKLINVDGSSAGATGPAAGIVFDRYIGGPYVVTRQSTGLPAGTQTFTMKSYAGSALIAPPKPQPNDVVMLDTDLLRPMVQTCTATTASGATWSGGTTASNPVTMTVNLKSPLANAISWSSTTTETAFLVHNKAFVVASNNGRGELRLYNNAEGVADYSNTASYIVLTQDLSGQTGENTPFSIVTQDGNKFLNIAMRVEDQTYNKVLALKQAKDFNSFLQIDTKVRPRN